MAEFKPTASQRQAIEARGGTVLVSAGAGSGKTKVLVERVLARILDKDAPCDIDKFLIITFTRAAAAELRGRIMSAFGEAIAADPANEHLRRQSALCRRAQIGTIDSFCTAVLRRFSHAAGIAPDFKIADDDRIKVMKHAALERVLEGRYERMDAYPGFEELVNSVGSGRDDSALEELVLSFYGKMQAHARPEVWAREQEERLSGELSSADETVWGREILAAVRKRAEYLASESEKLIALCPEDAKAVMVKYFDVLSDMAAQLRELSRCCSLGWDSARECAGAISFGRLNPPRKNPTKEYTDLVSARKSDIKKALDKLADMLAVSSEAAVSDMKLTAPSMCALLELTLDFTRSFANEKKRRSLLDYSDLEHLTVSLLTNEDGSPTDIAVQLSGELAEVMVDEYQDVSPVQDAIFFAVSDGGRRLFLVGDIKQSIYRFRLAEPEIFAKKYRSYAPFGEQAPGEPGKIVLSDNFRSRREIIECANSIFSACMSEEVGGVAYDETARLRFGAAGYEGSVPKPELILLPAEGGEAEADDGEDDRDQDAAPASAELEAEFMAKKIRSLIDSGTPVASGEGTRPLEYGDIAILYRSMKNSCDICARVLARHGIPVASGKGSGYFTSIEVSAAVSMLAVTDNPHQDIPLIAVLRSPCFGFTGDELSAIRIAAPKEDFFTALTVRAEEDGKCAAFLDKLAALRSVSADLPASELVWRVLEELDMLAVCSAMTDGAARRARLLELVELAEKYEAAGYRGLHRFVQWLRRQAEENNEPVVGVSGSAVRIMSMHGSKGLEFPVVFLAGLAKSFNIQDTHGRVLVHPKLGLGPRIIDGKRGIRYPSLACRAIALREKRELKSEEMRILYVAVTRARERLYMLGTVKGLEKKLEKLRKTAASPMESEELLSMNSMLDWVLSAAIADGGKTMALVPRPAQIEVASESAASAAGSAESAGLRAELERRLTFRYPYAEAETKPSKITATELKGSAEPDEDGEALLRVSGRSFLMPDFSARTRPLTGARKGSATHLVLQYMDYSRSGSVNEVRAEIDRLRRARFISDREAEAVDAGAIYRLFASPLGKRMLSADKLTREFKFSLMCDAGTDFGDQVLLQGVVDCCMEENGELVIIDYKTDLVRGEDELNARAGYYSGQLRAYASAMERIFKKPVRSCVLYFISAGKCVEVR